MKLTESKLRNIIREEVKSLNESPYRISGTDANTGEQVMISSPKSVNHTIFLSDRGEYRGSTTGVDYDRMENYRGQLLITTPANVYYVDNVEVLR